MSCPQRRVEVMKKAFQGRWWQSLERAIPQVVEAETKGNYILDSLGRSRLWGRWREQAGNCGDDFRAWGLGGLRSWNPPASQWRRLIANQYPNEGSRGIECINPTRSLIATVGLGDCRI
jgi:hypothetical protein